MTDALFSLTTGTDNTAIGFDALCTQQHNTATGLALYNTRHNTANGVLRSLATQPATTTRPTVLCALSNTTGSYNTANGVDALLATQPAATTRPTVLVRSISNTTGGNNTANGVVRSYTTPPAATTSHWAMQPVRISPPAVTISISATWCCWRVQHHPHRHSRNCRPRTLYRRHSVGPRFQRRRQCIVNHQRSARHGYPPRRVSRKRSSRWTKRAKRFCA